MGASIQQMAESLQRATVEIVNASREHTAKVTAYLRADFSRELANIAHEFAQHGEQIPSLLRAVDQAAEKMHLNVDAQSFNSMR